jgi:hypothetical protein
MKNKGQIAIPALLTVAAFVGAIVAPTMWFGELKEVNAVQDIKISTLTADIKEIKDNVEYTRRAIEAMSVKQGIQGVQGIQGTTGAQGVQGVRGAPGVPGNDAPSI